MSNSKKEEEKSAEMVAAEKRVELEKEMGAELEKMLVKHNCSLDGQMEVHDEKMYSQVLYLPHSKVGESEEDKKERSKDAKKDADELMEKHGYRLAVFMVMQSSGNRFGFRFVKKEEKK